MTTWIFNFKAHFIGAGSCNNTIPKKITGWHGEITEKAWMKVETRMIEQLYGLQIVRENWPAMSQIIADTPNGKIKSATNWFITRTREVLDNPFFSPFSSNHLFLAELLWYDLTNYNLSCCSDQIVPIFVNIWYFSFKFGNLTENEKSTKWKFKWHFVF